MTSTILFFTAIPIMVIYFYQFGKTMKILGEGERKRYVKKAGSKLNFLVMALLFGAFLYVNSFAYRLMIGVGIVLFMMTSTYLHHRKLKDLNFDPRFENKLLNVSYFSLFGTVLILASIIADTHAA